MLARDRMPLPFKNIYRPAALAVTHANLLKIFSPALILMKTDRTC
jgi:hypothetical protein